MENNTQHDNKPHYEEEIDFRSVLKTPARWFGLIYPYFLTLIYLGGIYYVKVMNTSYQNDIAPAIADSANVFNDVKAVKGSVSPGVDLKLISKPSEALIAKGKTIFQANCSSCHGNGGQGDGPAGAALNPKPRNFTSDQGWKNGRKFSDMFKTVQKGIPGSAMPAFEYLPGEDKIAVIEFIRTLANNFPPVTDAEISDMDKTYSLSKGTMVPSQIPVARAQQLAEQDAGIRVNEINRALELIDKNPDDPSAKLFNRIAADRFRALSFLSKNQGWTASQSEFARTVISAPGVNGFSREIVNLDDAQWTALFNYVKKLNIGKS